MTHDSNPKQIMEEGDQLSLSHLGWALMVSICLTATGGCQRGPDPLAKAIDAMGGREALLELRGFGYKSAGARFETGQGLNPTVDPITASSFTLALLCDIDNDALSLDWQRQIFEPLRGELAYRDVLNGELGYQTGNDSVFNPPGATSDRALTSERIAAVRREFQLLNPQLYLRAAAASEDAATVKANVELDGRSHHVIEVSDIDPIAIETTRLNWPIASSAADHAVHRALSLWQQHSILTPTHSTPCSTESSP